MGKTNTSTVIATVLNEETSISIGELCRICAVQIEWVEALVEEGVLEPREGERDGWLFPASALRWTRVAISLREDLGLNAAGVAMVLDMKQELDQLRARLKVLIGE